MMVKPTTVIDAFGSSVKFLDQFFKSPQVTGAIAPSSRVLAETIVDWVDWGSTTTLMEWGPGTGSFTEVILERKPSSCHYLALEINPEMCKILHERFPEIQIRQRSVAEVPGICAEECIESVDCIVSGLPWAAFSDELQDEFLEAMRCVLRRGGQFTTFAYLHGMALSAGRRFRRRLRRYFSQIEQSEVVWLNLPPAFVYRCRR